MEEDTVFADTSDFQFRLLSITGHPDRHTAHEDRGCFASVFVWLDDFYIRLERVEIPVDKVNGFIDDLQV